jgi:hypothetical protein
MTVVSMSLLLSAKTIGRRSEPPDWTDGLPMNARTCPPCSGATKAERSVLVAAAAVPMGARTCAVPSELDWTERDRRYGGGPTCSSCVLNGSKRLMPLYTFSSRWSFCPI